MHAKAQSNAQAMFNLGFMYEHGQGLPFDLHLAKRYYDQALEADSNAKLPVTLALMSLWIRNNYADSFLVSFLSSIPTCLFQQCSKKSCLGVRCISFKILLNELVWFYAISSDLHAHLDNSSACKEAI